MGVLLESVRVQHVGCVDDATLSLTPLHALIGPNDAGKSTLLRALQAALVAVKADQPIDATLGESATVDLAFTGTAVIRTGIEKPSLRLAQISVARGSARATLGDGAVVVRYLTNLRANGGAFAEGTIGLATPEEAKRYAEEGVAEHVSVDALSGIAEWLGAVPIIRLDPDALRKPTPLLGTGPVRLFDSRGTGLPSVLDAIRDRDDDAWSEIQERVRSLFPTVKQLRVSAVSANEKEVAVVLKSGASVGAQRLSEGMLYVLGVLAIIHGAPTSMVLMEEPETGLHPARIRDVMLLLRELSKTVPVVLATHSPLVVNELGAGEVTLVTRDEHGTHTTPLSQTKDYESRSRAYENGELWLSYGDPDLEKGLVSEAG